MISDLKMDTIRWNDEMRLSNNRDYKSSNTHRSRQKVGPTPEATPPSQHRGEEPHSTPFDSMPQTSEISYRYTYPERADRGQQSQTQGEYEEPTRYSDSFSRSGPQRHAPQGQESSASAYTQASTAIYIQNVQPHSATTTVPSSGAQSTFTRQDVEKMVIQRLRDQGHKQITRSQLDQAVDNAMRSLEAEASAREERATSVPPPYSEYGGGQGQPPPWQPNTSGTHGFLMTHATAGPDNSRPSNPDYSRPSGPDE